MGPCTKNMMQSACQLASCSKSTSSALTGIYIIWVLMAFKCLTRMVRSCYLQELKCAHSLLILEVYLACKMMFEHAINLLTALTRPQTIQACGSHLSKTQSLTKVKRLHCVNQILCVFSSKYQLQSVLYSFGTILKRQKEALMSLKLKLTAIKCSEDF